MKEKTILVVMNTYDKSYIPFLRPLLYGFKTKAMIAGTISTAAQLAKFAKDNDIDGILISGGDILSVVLKHNGLADDKPTVNHWMGSMLELDGIPTIFIPPLSHLTSVPHCEFLMKRFISKLVTPELWQRTHELTWELADNPNGFSAIRTLMSQAILISIDIETVSNSIKCCGFTGILKRDGQLYSHTVVVPIDTFEQYLLMKDLCENPVAKVFQNGNYDNTYLLRYAVATRNYLYDTYHLMHSWMVELPKSLGFISAMFLLDFRYWKYEANSFNQSDLYYYNAKDCHATAWAWIAMIQEMPDWAWQNYLMEFPGVFPATCCGLDGIKCDDKERKRLREEYNEKAQSALKKVQIMVDTFFNPASPKQVLALMHALGFKEAKSTEEKELIKFADKHPINSLIVEAILEYRGATKLVSTYLDFPQLNGRIMYKLDPAGTDTGRFASQKSNFSETTANTKGNFTYEHYGLQIQNVPVEVKSMFVPDNPDEEIAECDYSQSESRTTAYITRDQTLIEVVETSPDFHCKNASLFFGIPFEELYDAVAHKVLNKPIRILSKRVNHGSNYLMGAWKLWQTMGDKNVRHAQQLLKLPRRWRPVEVCEFLLGTFEKAYPDIHGRYMDELLDEIRLEGKMILPCAEFPWVRMTFLKPWESKLHKNTAMAHKPQSLSGLKANRSFYDVWKEFQIKQQRIRMKAPIHDSLFFTYKSSDEKVVKEVCEIMESPMHIHGVKMRIPSDAKSGASTWAGTKD